MHKVKHYDFFKETMTTKLYWFTFLIKNLYISYLYAEKYKWYHTSEVLLHFYQTRFTCWVKSAIWDVDKKFTQNKAKQNTKKNSEVASR